MEMLRVQLQHKICLRI